MPWLKRGPCRSWTWTCLALVALLARPGRGLFFPHGGSFGYLAAVATPLDLPNRNVYLAFNFEANYGLPSNDSYHEWIDRWNLDKEFLGIGNNVTAINGRRARRAMLHTRSSFYRSLHGYLEHFSLNGSACLQRTVCEVAASRLDEHNGLLGSFFRVLFTPSSSAPEGSGVAAELYEAEAMGEAADCREYAHWCPETPLDVVSKWL